MKANKSVKGKDTRALLTMVRDVGSIAASVTGSCGAGAVLGGIMVITSTMPIRGQMEFGGEIALAGAATAAVSFVAYKALLRK